MEEQELLEEQLNTVDQSIFFLILLILSVLLSFWSVLIQRGQLVCTIEGKPEAAAAAPKIYPIKISASALVVGSLGFFLCLALQACRSAAQDGDCVSQKSAGMNVWASLFVFAAALIRLYDLNFMERNQNTLVDENLQPE